MDEKVAVSALKQVKEVLDKYGVEFWLDSGTLLGAVRDGKLIPWDGDIDLAAGDSEEEKASEALKELHDKGTDKNYGVVVIHFYPLSSDKKCEKSGCRNLQVAMPIYYFMNLSTIPFYGMEFGVYAETEEYLAYSYGTDWRVPKKGYISSEHYGAICR